MSRKFLLILIVIMMLGGAGTAYWYFFLRTPGQKTPEIGTKTLKDYLPFGDGSLFNPTNTNTDGGTDVENNNEEPSVSTKKLAKITNFAIAGATFFLDQREIPTSGNLNNENSIPDTTGVITQFETVPSLRYVDRATGHIFQKYLDTNIEGKISNSTIPAIYETIFSGGAKNLIYRYLSGDRKTISSFLGTLGANDGEFLTENISDVSVSPDGTKFFYISPSSTGITGTVRNFGDTKKTQIFSSSFTEWLSQWATPQTIFLTTKASHSELGYTYSLNTSTGAFNAIFGGVQGLTTLGSPDGKLLLYSSFTNSGPKLGLFNISTRENKDLGLKGLPEKCVWGLNSLNVYCGIPNSTGKTEPDSWYQGLTSFDDNFVKINTATGNISTITIPDEETLDATHLFLDNKEQTLFFTNKKDSTLWSLDLK